MKTTPVSKNSQRRGFTLVELLVALSVFSIIISIAVGGFVRALRTQRQTIGLLASNSNASLTIEQMAREIRTGLRFRCGTGNPLCSGVPTVLTFDTVGGNTIWYCLNGAVINRYVGTLGDCMTDGTPITAVNVNVKQLSFRVFFNQRYPADLYPARIVISMTVSPLEQGVQGAELNFQTTVSARNLST